jgi:6-phosphogluconolactonase (cycloisomerase 2 family)
MLLQTIVSVTLLLVAGCGGGGDGGDAGSAPGPAPIAYVYTVNGGSFIAGSPDPQGTVSAFVADSAGTLTPVPGSPFLAGILGTSLALHPTEPFLFVASNNAPHMSVFQIDRATGGLTLIDQHFLDGFSKHVVVHPSGRFLYLLTVVPDQIILFDITSTGTNAGRLTPKRSFLQIRDPKFMAIHPSGRFLYTSFSMDNAINHANIDATSGDLSNTSFTPINGGPESLGMKPDGGTLYVITKQNELVRALNIALWGTNQGSVSPIDPGVKTKSNASSFAIDLLGRFAYIPNHDSRNISGYAVNEKFPLCTGGVVTCPIDGQLIEIPGSPFASEKSPLASAMDPTGNFLYVSHDEPPPGSAIGGYISTFQVNQTTGVLTDTGFRVATDSSPTQIVTMPR